MPLERHALDRLWRPSAAIGCDLILFPRSMSLARSKHPGLRCRVVLNDLLVEGETHQQPNLLNDVVCRARLIGIFVAQPLHLLPPPADNRNPSPYLLKN